MFKVFIPYIFVRFFFRLAKLGVTKEIARVNMRSMRKNRIQTGKIDKKGKRRSL